jgi:hypothetical protein
MTMDEILLEIRALREIVQSLQPASEVGHKCKGVTGKGGLCRNRSAPGSEYCRMHGDVQCKPVRVPRVAKKVKEGTAGAYTRGWYMYIMWGHMVMYWIWGYLMMNLRRHTPK